DPAYLRGRSPADVVIAEKNRENRLRRLVRGLSRWEPKDLYPPSRMISILERAGLPRSRRRSGVTRVLLHPRDAGTPARREGKDAAGGAIPRRPRAPYPRRSPRPTAARPAHAPGTRPGRQHRHR